jgi:SAM-dependent methyltransferase
MYLPAIAEPLSQEWGLSSRLRQLFDKREGVQCICCRANWRVRHLADVLLREIEGRTGKRYETIAKMVRDSAAHALTLAEINELPGLHRFLSRLSGLSYSEYGGANSEDLMALSYADEAFDYVLTSDTLEHVPDFDLALSELYRILKPGGKHIFTIPIIWDRQTRQRAKAVNGVVVHQLSPSHHGDPQKSPDDYLVFNEFGGDVVERIERAGFSVTLIRDPKNEVVVTIIATKAANSCAS